MMPLVEPLIPGLRRYARALMHEAAAADDLVQDCLERAITRWHQRRSDGDAKTWMFAILHNLAVNRLRQVARRGPHMPVENSSEDVLASPASQESRLHQRDIQAAVGRLPYDQRTVLLLVAVEDLSYAETAKAMNIPVGTVMSRLSRARERLRRDMEGEPTAIPILRSVR